MNFRVNISKVFMAGLLGGLANAVLIWAMGKTGITQSMGVLIVPTWTTAYLYSKLVWGGIWGGMFLLPILEGSVLRRGVILSLAPTAVVLFYVLPYQLNQGMMGQRLGELVPVFALMVNAVWGIVAAWWVRD